MLLAAALVHHVLPFTRLQIQTPELTHMPNVTEVEDPGISVDDIIDDREKLEQKAKLIV